MAKKFRRRRGRNERLESCAGAVVAATCWLRFSVGVAIVVMVLLAMFLTRRAAIVVAIVPQSLYEVIKVACPVRKQKWTAIERDGIVRVAISYLRRYKINCLMNLLLRHSLGGCLRP